MSNADQFWELARELRWAAHSKTKKERETLIERARTWTQAALIAEAFTPRLRYSGSSLGYQLASVIAGGPAPLIATALFATYHSGYAISIYIATCTVVSLISAAFMPDYTGKDISMEYDEE